jgi:hypothetical protein
VFWLYEFMDTETGLKSLSSLHEAGSSKCGGLELGHSALSCFADLAIIVRRAWHIL